MKKFTYQTIALVVSLIVAGNAHAAKQDKEKSIKEQVSEFKVDETGKTTLSDKELTDKIYRDQIIRDAYREDEQMSILEYNAIAAKSNKLDKERDVIIQEFILENVPKHIIASGDKAINIYVNEHFGSSKTAKEAQTVDTLWESTPTAIAIPITSQSHWQPEVNVVSTQTQSPASEPNTPDSSELSDSDKNALAELGMTEEDLKAMLGDDAPKSDKEDVAEKETSKEEVKDKNNITPQDEGHVILDKISVERVVIMGKSKFVDLNITFKQVIRGMQRTINKTFENMEPGAIFQIENNRFELVSLNRNQIVFENLDTKKTFRELID